MEKRLFLTAVAIAVIGGIAGSFTSPDLANIAAFLVVGAGAWIGWNCAGGDSSKDYAMGAAFLVFLNAPGWGDAGTKLGGSPWIGAYVGGIFEALVGLITVIAAVGILKNLMDRAEANTR